MYSPSKESTYLRIGLYSSIYSKRKKAWYFKELPLARININQPMTEKSKNWDGPWGNSNNTWHFYKSKPTHQYKWQFVGPLEEFKCFLTLRTVTFFGPILITINFLTFPAQLPLGLSSMVLWIKNCMGCYNLRVLVIFASLHCVSFCFVSYQLPNVENHCFKESCFQWNNNDFSIINWFFLLGIFTSMLKMEVILSVLWFLLDN